MENWSERWPKAAAIAALLGGVAVIGLVFTGGQVSAVLSTVPGPALRACGTGRLDHRLGPGRLTKTAVPAARRSTRGVPPPV